MGSAARTTHRRNAVIDQALEIPLFVRDAIKERMAFGRLVQAALAVQGRPSEPAKREYRRALKAAARYFPAAKSGQHE